MTQIVEEEFAVSSSDGEKYLRLLQTVYSNDDDLDDVKVKKPAKVKIELTGGKLKWKKLMDTRKGCEKAVNDAAAWVAVAQEPMIRCHVRRNSLGTCESDGPKLTKGEHTTPISPIGVGPR